VEVGFNRISTLIRSFTRVFSVEDVTTRTTFFSRSVALEEFGKVVIEFNRLYTGVRPFAETPAIIEEQRKNVSFMREEVVSVIDSSPLHPIINFQEVHSIVVSQFKFDIKKSVNEIVSIVYRGYPSQGFLAAIIEVITIREEQNTIKTLPGRFSRIGKNVVEIIDENERIKTMVEVLQDNRDFE